jgi:hypothetical protein
MQSCNDHSGALKILNLQHTSTDPRFSPRKQPLTALELSQIFGAEKTDLLSSSDRAAVDDYGSLSESASKRAGREGHGRRLSTFSSQTRRNSLYDWPGRTKVVRL